MDLSKYKEMFIQECKTRDDYRNVRARLVQMSLINPDGDLMFAPDEVEAVGALSARLVDEIFEAAKALNVLEKTDDLPEKS